MTLHDVLRAIVRGDGHLLNDSKWVARAVAAVDAHEAASQPSTPEPDVPPAPVPEQPAGGGL